MHARDTLPIAAAPRVGYISSRRPTKTIDDLFRPESMRMGIVSGDSAGASFGVQERSMTKTSPGADEKSLTRRLHG